MSMMHQWNASDEVNQNTCRNTSSRTGLSCHKSLMDVPGIEPTPLQCEAGVKCLRHGTAHIIFSRVLTYDLLYISAHLVSYNIIY
jgi:hypothetical protein